MKKCLSKNCKKIFFYQKYEHLGKNTFKHCSRIIVVHIHVNVFLSSKIHPACHTHSDANGIKPGSNQKVTVKSAAEDSKTVCWDVN